MYIETKDAQISGAVGRYSMKFAPGKVFTVYPVSYTHLTLPTTPYV